MVYKKLLEIQSAVRAMKKNARAYKYDYLNGETILSVIRPLMDEKSLLLIPHVEGVRTTPIQYDKWDRDAGKVVTATEVLVVLEMTMEWVDAEDGESVKTKWASTGQNGFDKSFGSALTYGERYYLLKLFHLQTDRDDVDAISAKRDEAVEQVSQAQPAKAKLAKGGTLWKKAVKRISDGDDIKGKMFATYEMTEAMWEEMMSEAEQAVRNQ